MKNREKRKRIAFVGLDGSGKSANIASMKQDPAYEACHFIWVRWKPGLLRPAYWLLNHRLRGKSVSPKEGEDRTRLMEEYQKKSGVKERIFKISLLRRIWFCTALLDYLIQFYIKTAGLLLLKQNIIFDRSYLDFFVDQGISFGYSPKKIKEELEKYQFLFPTIGCFLYLKVSPEICYQRKQDIPDMEYLLKRYKVYEYLSRDKGWVIIDGELPLDTVNRRIKEEIFKKERRPK